MTQFRYCNGRTSYHFLHGTTQHNKLFTYISINMNIIWIWLSSWETFTTFVMLQVLCVLWYMCTIYEKFKGLLKWTKLIPSMKSTPSHIKAISFTCSLVIKLNTRTLLVVLECLKDRAFHIETVYVNSLDPSRAALSKQSWSLPLQAEATALQWESVVAGESPVS